MRKALFALSFLVGAVAALPAQAGGFLQDLFSPERAAPTAYQYAPAQPQMRFVYDQGFRVSRRPTAATKMVRGKQTLAQRKAARKKAALLARKRGYHASTAAFARNSGFKASATVAVAGAPAAKAAANRHLQPALCCKNGEDPAQLIHADATLRVGDAYMTPQGLRIYRGGQDARHRPAFVDYRKAEIGNEMKARLAALEDRRGHADRPAIRTIATPMPAIALAPVVPRQVTYASRTDDTRTSLDPTGRVIRVVGP